MRVVATLLIMLSGFILGCMAMYTGLATYHAHLPKIATVTPTPTFAINVLPPPDTLVVFPAKDVVEFEYGNCWIVVNVRKKAVHQSCSDLGPPKVNPGSLSPAPDRQLQRSRHES